MVRNEGILKQATVKELTKHTMPEVKDPEVAKKLIPTFEVGCKRITPSNGYLQSFNRDKVSLVTDGIDCITEDDIKTKDGTLYKVDAIVHATGISPIESGRALDAYGQQNEHMLESKEVSKTKWTPWKLRRSFGSS